MDSKIFAIMKTRHRTQNIHHHIMYDINAPQSSGCAVQVDIFSGLTLQRYITSKARFLASIVQEFFDYCLR